MRSYFGPTFSSEHYIHISRTSCWAEWHEVVWHLLHIQGQALPPVLGVLQSWRILGPGLSKSMEPNVLRISALCYQRNSRRWVIASVQESEVRRFVLLTINVVIRQSHSAHTHNTVFEYHVQLNAREQNSTFFVLPRFFAWTFSGAKCNSEIFFAPYNATKKSLLPM
jgi:hypothetical protein